MRAVEYGRNLLKKLKKMAKSPKTSKNEPQIFGGFKENC